MNLTDNGGQPQAQPQMPWPGYPADAYAYGMPAELSLVPLLPLDELRLKEQFTQLLTVETLDRFLSQNSAQAQRRSRVAYRV